MDKREGETGHCATMREEISGTTCLDKSHKRLEEHLLLNLTHLCITWHGMADSVERGCQIKSKTLTTRLLKTCDQLVSEEQISHKRQ